MKKTIIITGTSSGLGHSFFDILIKRKDDKIVSLSRNFLSYQKKIAKNNNIKLVKVDLSDFKVVNKLNFSDKLENFITNDIIFINNAGVIHPIGGLGNLKEDQVIENVNVNFLSPIILLNKLVKLKNKKRFRLKIINISSGAAENPVAGWSLYCSTKAAIKMFFNTIVSSAGESKIEVINIDPGAMDTKMQKEIRESKEKEFVLKDKFIKYYKKQLLKNPDDVALGMCKKYIFK